MYKVFYKDRTVFFIENETYYIDHEDHLIHYFKNKEQLKTALDHFVDNEMIIHLYIVHQDIKAAFDIFCSFYKIIEAAGGLVKSNDNKVLVIFRRGKWDLPKGKLEKDETAEIGALREVEEECSLDHLEIQKLIETTYHTYKIGDQDILKRTYWFEMIHKGNLEPKPQTEEEITEVKWIDTHEITKISKKTFPSIIEVLKKGKVY